MACTKIRVNAQTRSGKQNNKIKRHYYKIGVNAHARSEMHKMIRLYTLLRFLNICFWNRTLLIMEWIFSLIGQLGQVKLSVFFYIIYTGSNSFFL